MTDFKSEMKYQIIYADPPWKCWFGGNRNASRYYKCMTLDDIKKLPIPELSDVNCFLFLWVIFPLLPEGIEVLRAWGFKYATCAFTWVKQNPKNLEPFMGCGYWTRANAEICLLGTKGKLERKSRSVKQIILSPRERHSKKPDETRNRITNLLGELPRVELFARQKTEGWDIWGNEVVSDINLGVSNGL